jgi:alkanesulfonate monooxygenase SsuD/methylene tetrahydromethanopterin reductase-like flavin-dependent oxidoreductase (luciferase family)
MRIGIGLPAAVPGTPGTTIGPWASEAERLGFRSLGVIDRLVYDNLDPLMALAAAAARTERVELLTTVLNVPYRQNAVVLAKQLASLDRLSGGRLTTGLGLGGWPEDYAVSELPLSGRGATLEGMLATMRRAWAGELAGAGGPMPALGEDRPGVLLAGLIPAAFERVAALGEGWVSPAFGFETFTDGVASVRRAWADAGRPGRPRFVTIRYFCLGDHAGELAEEYLEHYYGSEYLSATMADTLTSQSHLREELLRLSAAGCDDLVLLPCTSELDQVKRLADALDANGGAFELAA